MADEASRLREELQQLHEEYKALESNFDSMSEGYQESLMLYDKLENAMKFTHPAEAAGGAQAMTEKASVRLNVLLTAEQQIAFAVEDTGIGVPPEEAEHIFEEFVQLNDYYYRTGIGLTVARSIARRLGGDIVLDTTYTDRTRFVFTLPTD